MNAKNQEPCKACGGTSFSKGKVSNNYAKIMPISKFFSTGSSLIYTFCKDCGEVSSIKVEDTSKFF
ncbi:hypothetical protein [Neobacillus rhizophilus]|uniref:Transcription initiation factor TFIIIB n=1 Tax=Neobacillus rhizophilus TaxID=2833579 RepID=A0A942UDI4_9BACI|nr:hypothetical protein [Neobacillus rhizophilus]MBS4216214.1 hypothetical protein [Neobacillus rhizophilus]